MKNSRERTRGLLLAAAMLSWMLPWPAEAGGVIVVVRNGTAERRDAQSGAYRGTVGQSGAVAASTDGTTIAVLYKDGRVMRYDARTGAYRGTVGTGKATAVQVSSGVIVITHADGRSMRYDAATGSYKGTI